MAVLDSFRGLRLWHPCQNDVFYTYQLIAMNLAVYSLFILCIFRFKQRNKEESDMNTNVVGLDIVKNIFHLYSLSEDGKATKKKLKRAELLRFFANYPVSLIDMEACGVHYWAREYGLRYERAGS
jgi:transposase